MVPLEDLCRNVPFRATESYTFREVALILILFIFLFSEIW